MANDVLITVGANTENFQVGIDKAYKTLSTFGVRNKELANEIDKAYKQISQAAASVSGEIQSSFNALQIKSDTAMIALKESATKASQSWIFDFTKIANSADTTANDVMRAFRGLQLNEAKLAANELSAEFKSLGIQSTASIEAMKIKIQNDFKEIEASGIKYPRDIVRAHEVMTAEIERLDQMLLLSGERVAAERAAAFKRSAESERASYTAQSMTGVGAATTIVGQKLAGPEFSSDLKAQMESSAQYASMVNEKVASEQAATAKINALHEEALRMDMERNKKRLMDEEATTRKIAAMQIEANKINADFKKGLVTGEGTYKDAADGINLFNLASVAAIAKIQILYSLVNTTMSAIASFPGTVMTAVEDYQSSVVANAAMITSMQTGLSDVGKAYQENKAYAEAVESVLIKMDTQTSASAKNLRDMNVQFTQQGVLIDANNQKQYEGFKNIANALTVMNANAPNKEQQYSQEIRSLQDFSTRPGNKLVQYLQSQGVTKEMVEGWKQVGIEIGNSGYLLEKLDGYFKGFAEASKDIDGLWSTIKSTLSTTYNEILRGAMTDAVKEITQYFKDMNTELSIHKEQIESGIYRTWISLKGVVESVSILISSLNPVLNETDSIIGMIFKGWGLIASVALPVIAEEIKGLISVLNAMVNIIYESVLAAFSLISDLVDNIAIGIVKTGKAMGQMIKGDFEGAGKTAGDIFSFKFLSSFKDHMAGIKGAAITIKEEYNKDSSFDRRYADWNKSFAPKEKGNVKTPTGMNPAPIDEKAIAAADALRKAQLAQTDSYTKLQREKIKQSAAEELEINEENYKWGLIDLKAYLGTKHKYAQEALEEQIADQKKMASEYGKEAATFSGRGEKKDDLKYAEAMKKVNEASKTQIQLEGQLAILKLKNADEDKERTKKILDDFASQHNSIIELSGDYIATAESKKKLDMDSEAYSKLVALSYSSNIAIRTAAEQALADKKQKWMSDNIAAEQKVFEETKKQIAALSALNATYAALMGFNISTVEASKKMADGIIAANELELQLKIAINNKDEKLTANLKERLTLQNKINEATGEEYNTKIRAELLKGGIVGFSSSAVSEENKAGAIFVNDFKSVVDYMSDKELMNADKNSAAADKTSSAAAAMSGAGASMQNAGNAMMSAANLTQEAVTGFYKFADPENADRIATSIVGAISSTSLAGLKSSMQFLPTTGPSTRLAGGMNISGRAIGGDVDPYTPYIVGEKGPELFMTKQGGSIIPNDKLRSSQQPSSNTSAMHFAGGVSVNLPGITSASDYKTIAKGVLAELKIQNNRFI